MPATHIQTPIGPIAIHPSAAAKLHAMTDREVAAQAFESVPGFIDPEALAELVDRGLAGPGMFMADIYRRIEVREAKKA